MYKRQQVKVFVTSHVWPVIFGLAVLVGLALLLAFVT